MPGREGKVEVRRTRKWGTQTTRRNLLLRSPSAHSQSHGPPHRDIFDSSDRRWQRGRLASNRHPHCTICCWSSKDDIENTAQNIQEGRGISLRLPGDIDRHAAPRVADGAHRLVRRVEEGCIVAKALVRAIIRAFSSNRHDVSDRVCLQTQGERRRFSFRRHRGGEKLPWNTSVISEFPLSNERTENQKSEKKNGPKRSFSRFRNGGPPHLPLSLRCSWVHRCSA